MSERIDTKAALDGIKAAIQGEGKPSAETLLAWWKGLAQEITDREALEMERDEWGAATRYLQGHYPEDVFPPNSNTPDAKAGTFARRLLGWLLDPVERTRLAALPKDTGTGVRSEEET